MYRPQGILVTGGAGFIGSNFLHYLFGQPDFAGKIVNMDSLTYAGNLENLAEIDREYGGKRYFFEKTDICDKERVREIFSKHNIDTVIHFAAESHVDRAIAAPGEFVRTNINGTFNLLEAARNHWGDRQDVLFHFVSTDEVYGSLGDTGFFYEHTPYSPRSPYSAAKASAAHLVKAYFHTYKLPVTLSNCSNNYGPYQFPEKLIPLMIIRAMQGKSLPIYGDGKNVRDWLFVGDHCAAVHRVVSSGRRGEEYNVGGESERRNLDVVQGICDYLEQALPFMENEVACRNAPGKKSYRDLVNFVTDRPGHDKRYAVNCDKIKKELSWQPSISFEEGLEQTISWYIENSRWVENVQSGEYKKWLDKNYTNRT